MSFLSGSTKKVSVYGRKAEVRVVNRHSAFTTLDADENDLFGFFNSQAKPKSAYGRSRASLLASQLHATAETETSEADDTLESQSETGQSAAYDTANTSASFHSACSSSSSPKPASKSTSGAQRTAPASKALNSKDAATHKSTSKPAKAAVIKVQDEAMVNATPKSKRGGPKRGPTDSPQTVRKAPKPKASAASSLCAVVLPIESTPPPPAQQTGRAPRRAAQAARIAIEDYDFSDRDMTPRRPVPTKSYFVEKAKQLAEWALEDEHEQQQAKQEVARSIKTSASTASKTSRKSMAARPRHTSARGSSRASAFTISDSSLSSATGASGSSFEGGSTSGSSFSLVIPRHDDSNDLASKRSAAKALKAKQNKRVTRRIAASSDDENEDHNNADELGSDDEAGQDPALKLAAQVADLAVVHADAVDNYLSDLLDAVSQSKPESFCDTVQRLRTTITRSTSGAAKMTKTRRRIEKIGEASFSEVFKIFAPPTATSTATPGHDEALVLKVIPIASTAVSNDDEDLPFSSPAVDVDREIRLMQLIERESACTKTDAFVSLRSAHVVKGAYPSALLQAWDRWDTKRRAKAGEGAENIRPDVFGSQQVYALLVMTDGGMDLESLKVKSWLQAASIFWQVVTGLSEMESRIEFEHRDLHWGNILVQAVTSSEQASRRSSVLNLLLDPRISGVKATIIDFTLSRATIPPASKGRSKEAEVLHYPFDDESLFQGSGDPQFDVYREMRTVTSGDWSSYTPSTNMLWLRYLAHKLIKVKCKSCKAPKSASEEGEADAYTSLQNAAARLDEAAENVLGQKQGRSVKPTAGRKSLHPRSRKSVAAPVAAGGARRGRATTAVTPLLHAQIEDAVQSAAQLMTLLN
ncbi:hypothetical protein NDA14_003614 [Ustilago hordei]|nr:hypothetical protein NDA14_003614 [Ustilago hordei]